MINTVKVTNYRNESITMELRKPEVTGFAITSISGLGPADANINYTEVSTNDGSIYNSSRLNSRNILLQMRFLPSPTIELTRQKTYKYFPVKRPLTLEFETDSRRAEIVGYVESNESNIFSDKEGATISIVCPDPFFYSTEQDATETAFSSLEDIFEFEFSNESLEEDMIEFGNIEAVAKKVIEYTGDYEIGLTMELYAIGAASNITLYNLDTHESMRIDTNKLEQLTGRGFDNGDRITIVTIKGKKRLTLLREGIEYNILNCLDKNSDWFLLSKGDNQIGYSAESGSANIQLTIKNRVIYEGV